jgi:hypothetical protein
MASDVRTAPLYLIVPAFLVLLDVVALTRRVVGVRGRFLGSAARGGRASAHSAKSFPPTHLLFGPRYPGPPLSPQVASAKEVAATRATKAINIR